MYLFVYQRLTLPAKTNFFISSLGHHRLIVIDVTNNIVYILRKSLDGGYKHLKASHAPVNQKSNMVTAMFGGFF